MRKISKKMGNIQSKATPQGTYNYTYDALYRLTDVEVDVPEVNNDEAFTYDAVGNRKTEAGVDGDWNYNENNELLTFADVEYVYDDNGNMTQITVAGSVVWTYVYDAANRLIHVEDGTGSISADYYYDPFGRRLWKDVSGTRTYFFYSDEGLVAEYDASGDEIKTYGYKPDSTWTTDPLFLKENGQYYFYQNDHLGTPQKLVGVNGAVVWSAVYNAFGKAEVQVETVTNNLRFPGQYWDAETGLYYNWFRYYDPGIGRYLVADPIGLMGEINLYAYTLNDPIRMVDPWGLFEIDGQLYAGMKGYGGTIRLLYGPERIVSKFYLKNQRVGDSYGRRYMGINGKCYLVWNYRIIADQWERTWKVRTVTRQERSEGAHYVEIIIEVLHIGHIVYSLGSAAIQQHLAKEAGKIVVEAGAGIASVEGVKHLWGGGWRTVDEFGEMMVPNSVEDRRLDTVVIDSGLHINHEVADCLCD